MEFHVSQALGELVVDMEQAVLVAVEQHQACRARGRDLPAQLRADGPASAGHDDTLALKELANWCVVQANGFPGQ